MKTISFCPHLSLTVFQNRLMRLRRVPHCDKFAAGKRTWMLEVRSVTPGFHGWEPVTAVHVSDFIMETPFTRSQQHCAEVGGEKEL